MWELRAHGKLRSSDIKTKSTAQAIPTPTHMMFVKLMQEGVLKAVVSQNCDGLHRRSGLPVKGTCVEMECVGVSVCAFLHYYSSLFLLLTLTY